MVIIDDIVNKQLGKGKVPKYVFKNIYTALVEIDKDKNVDLYDCRDYQDQHHKYQYHYYRIRKGDYRGIFYFDNGNTYLFTIGKRDEVYKTKLI